MKYTHRKPQERRNAASGKWFKRFAVVVLSFAIVLGGMPMLAVAGTDDVYIEPGEGQGPAATPTDTVPGEGEPGEGEPEDAPAAPANVVGSIGGSLWLDENANKTRDAGENTAIAGYPVRLYRAEDTATPLQTAETDATGAYLFEGLAGGAFHARTAEPLYAADGRRRTADGRQQLWRAGF